MTNEEASDTGGGRITTPPPPPSEPEVESVFIPRRASARVDDQEQIQTACWVTRDACLDLGVPPASRERAVGLVSRLSNLALSHGRCLYLDLNTPPGVRRAVCLCVEVVGMAPEELSELSGIPVAGSNAASATVCPKSPTVFKRGDAAIVRYLVAE